jgi:hypothetical protein
MFVVVVYSLVNTIASLVVDCSKDARCQGLFSIFIVCAAINVATDISILLLPFWLLRPMKVPFIHKISIAFILMAGGL